MATITSNKRVFHDYKILKKYEAGLVLTGAEVKSVKNSKIILKGSYVKINSRLEAYLINCHIAPYPPAKELSKKYDPLRPKKLLLNKKEIDFLSSRQKEKGLTVLPLSVYTKGGYIKLEIGIGQGQKKYEKREELKKQELKKRLRKRLRR